MYTKFFKRVFDILLSLVAISLTILPMAIVCLVVKLESKGPAIFKSERIGKDGKVFILYKVRTMRNSAPNNMATRDIDGQKYITTFGAFLRKSSLDELPQFFNILKGDMSIVGPRPACLCEKDLHQRRFQNGSYTVRPGLTGLAQVNGRDVLALDFEKKAALDSEYVKRLSFWTDLKIFLKTFIVVFKAESVVEGHGAEMAPNFGDEAEGYVKELAMSVSEDTEIPTEEDKAETVE